MSDEKLNHALTRDEAAVVALIRAVNGIRESMAWHRQTTGIKPTQIFVGERTMQSLEFPGPVTLIREKKMGPHFDRISIDGIPVYQVNAVNFLGFGVEAPSPCG